MAFLGPSPDLITGSLPLRRRLFCWIYRWRNPQLRQAQSFCLIPVPCPASHMQLPVVQRSLLRCKPPSSNCEEPLKAPCRSPCWLLGEHHGVSGMGGLGLQMQMRSSPSLFTIMPAAADQGDKWGSEVPSWHSCHVTRTAGIATTCLSCFL